MNFFQTSVKLQDTHCAECNTSRQSERISLVQTLKKINFLSKEFG
jgi:hypothetical protein